MMEAPRPDYRIVERDGLLVVEPNPPEETSPSRSAQSILSTGRWQGIGLKLFALRYDPERFIDGKAIVPAGQLPDMISLDAPGGALYFVTRQQQALLGYLMVPKAMFAVILIIGILAYQAESPIWFALFGPLSLLAVGFGLWGWSRILAIRQQPFRPEAETGEKRPSPR